MSLDLTIRLMEIMMGLAFAQQSLEYLASHPRLRLLFSIRLLLCICLIFGIYAHYTCLGLFSIGLGMLHLFNGPYNGGSDRMGLLILSVITITHFAPEPIWREVAIGYLALQLTLSYFISGWVKIVNPAWRSGQALHDVFKYSAYPVSQTLRGWAQHPKLLKNMSWAVILFELAFPFCLISQPSLIVGLILAGSFHLANACLFGLNRFFWIWLTAYPAILWFQDRVL